MSTFYGFTRIETKYWLRDVSHPNKRYVKRKKKCSTLTKFMLEKGGRTLGNLRDTWSPEQITGCLFQEEGLSFKTIYRLIYSGLLQQKGKRQKSRETRRRLNVGLPISKRPMTLNGDKRSGIGSLIILSQVEGSLRHVSQRLSNEKAVFVSMYQWKRDPLYRWSLRFKQCISTSRRECFELRRQIVEKGLAVTNESVIR